MTNIENSHHKTNKVERKLSAIKQRILDYADFKGYSRRKIYLDTGIANGILSQPSGINEESMERFISTYQEVNPAWLVTGEGTMLKAITKKYTIDDQVSQVEDKPPPNNFNNLKRIPFVDVGAIAGFGNLDFSIGDRDVKDFYVIPKFKDRQVDFMIEVFGASMYPTYNSGDVVACKIIRESSFIQWNKVHIIATREQGILIKRLDISEKDDCLLAISDNQQYRPFDIPRSEITGIAIVVGVIRLE